MAIVQDEFKVVKYRNGRKYKSRYKQIISNPELESPVNLEHVLRKIKKCRYQIRLSEQFDIFIKGLINVNEQLNEFDDNRIDKICEELVCYGIGNFSKCYIALYQLALLLELKCYLNVKVSIYDPIFTGPELEILSKLDLNLITYNESGKRQVIERTLFFMPHCPRELFNNLLWMNWGLSLSDCIILGNQYSSVITNNVTSSLNSFKYITKISPAIVEYEIPNIFEYKDIFNNLAYHIFPPEKLKKLSSDIWKYHDIPIYTENSELIL